MTTGAAELHPKVRSWAASEFGIVVQDSGSPVGLTMNDLIEVGLRRNPRRAQLLVSTILGKHLAADPRIIAGTGRLLGALVARKLAGDDSLVPTSWTHAAHTTMSGEDPGGLLDLHDFRESRTTDNGPNENAAPGLLTLGFAETATSLGHLVADQLQSAYLHSTRRRDGRVPITAEFAEPHSHATGHLLRPDPPSLLRGTGPVVLVDDELSTGRTALNVIEALHAFAPRNRYVLAGLVDVRAPADDRNRAMVAERLGFRIDVVSLVRGAITLPADVVDRVAAEFANSANDPRGGESQRLAAPHSRLDLPWPVDLSTGGRHGFVSDDRPAFDSAIRLAAAMLAAAAGSSERILVLGTEELMYLPLRLALELARDPLHSMAFQSTTRSPAHVIDHAGYPIRRRIDFHSAVVGDSDDAHERVLRHVYNAGWPGTVGEPGSEEADLIVVVDDGHAQPGHTGIAESLAAATGAPVLLAALNPSPTR